MSLWCATIWCENCDDSQVLQAQIRFVQICWWIWIDMLGVYGMCNIQKTTENRMQSKCNFIISKSKRVTEWYKANEEKYQCDEIPVIYVFSSCKISIIEKWGEVPDQIDGTMLQSSMNARHIDILWRRTFASDVSIKWAQRKSIDKAKLLLNRPFFTLVGAATVLLETTSAVQYVVIVRSYMRVNAAC